MNNPGSPNDWPSVEEIDRLFDEWEREPIAKDGRSIEEIVAGRGLPEETAKAIVESMKAIDAILAEPKRPPRHVTLEDFAYRMLASAWQIKKRAGTPDNS